MTTVTLKFNENTKDGKMIKLMLKAFQELSGVKITEDKIPNETTLKAMANVKRGKTIRTKNYNDFLNKMNS